jgi:multimeric flavodoxin WrbA
MMKKILLVDSSPRKNGNSEVIVDTLATDLKNAEVTVFKMREKRCNPCRACAICQNKDSQQCVQKDDITNLLPLLDTCDAVVLATPIYNHQINSQAKLFIERFYPFFNLEKRNMSNTSKCGKKAALICSCWAGPKDIYEKYADWTVKNFSQIGAEEMKSIVFDHIPGQGDVKNNGEYMKQLHELAKWLEA